MEARRECGFIHVMGANGSGIDAPFGVAYGLGCGLLSDLSVDTKTGLPITCGFFRIIASATRKVLDKPHHKCHRELSASQPSDFPRKKPGAAGASGFNLKLAESWGFEPQIPLWGILA